MFGQIFRFLELIKFSHSIFALPFALLPVMILWARDYPTQQGWPMIFLWIVVAMVGARSGAMGFNRLVDLKYDRENPRTRSRPSASGEVSPRAMIGMILVSYGLLVYAAYQLNPLAFYLSPVAIFLVSFYSYTKRFTSLCHVFLGLAIGAAPIASHIAVTGEITLASLMLGLSVLTWISGFDVLYALQDLEYDKERGLHSIPVALGVSGSLNLARILHLATVGLWGYYHYLEGLGSFFLAGMGLSALLLLYEHSLVKKDDLSKLNMAFFNMNAVISVTLFLALSLDLLVN